MSLGYSAWFDEQFATARPKTYKQWMTDASADPAAQKYLDDENHLQLSAWWSQAVQGPDQLRQRTAWALAQIVVVSGTAPGVNLSPYWTLMGNYGDRLADNAFGNYRQVLDRVTYAPHMGVMLTYMGNERENYGFQGQQPDQNFARELMQLFSIGLWQLNTDGTRKKDSAGNDIPAYTTADVVGLASVFTGLGGTSDMERGDMSIDENRHSCAEKRFLGVVIDQGKAAPARTSAGLGQCNNANGKTQADVKIALDTVFNHPNVGPFIGRQLIQRFTSSNPSPDYVRRVAEKFNDNGAGVRGDLRAVIKQVLLDPEARDPARLGRSDAGKIREPVLRAAHMMRLLNHKFADGRVWAQLGSGNCYNIWGLTTGVDQNPFHAPTVFNFYRPGFAPPATKAAAANLVAPEMQTLDTVSLVNWSRFVADSLRRNGAGLSVYGLPGRATNDSCPSNNPTFDYSTLTAVADTPEQLVDALDTLLTGGTFSNSTRAALLTAITAVPGSGSTRATNRVKVGLQIALLSPQYLVQR
jgi:uncharacterized protein (DUF1800 family)